MYFPSFKGEKMFACPYEHKIIVAIHTILPTSFPLGHPHATFKLNNNKS